MSETNFQKIDKYFVTLVLVLVLMAGLLTISFKGVFSAFLLASDLDSTLFDNTVRINQNNLDEAYGWGYKREALRLEAPLEK
jgi:hypothetical protein